MTTLRAAIADDAQPSDLVRRRHLFPLRAAGWRAVAWRRAGEAILVE
jgi:hypothetical protein